MTLMEFSMIPLDKGDSFNEYVARILSLVDQSGLEYRLNPMGTVVEGEWDELLKLLTRCFRALEQDSNRISLQVKFDYRKDPSFRRKSESRDFKKLENHLDPGFHRGDDFLQVHQYWIHTLLRTTPFIYFTAGVIEKEKKVAVFCLKETKIWPNSPFLK